MSCHQGELTSALTHFLSERDDSPNTVLQVLSSAMALLRRCRVNAALTIQLFSQLFHFVNMMAFNKIVTSPSQQQVITTDLSACLMHVEECIIRTRSRNAIGRAKFEPEKFLDLRKHFSTC